MAAEAAIKDTEAKLTVSSTPDRRSSAEGRRRTKLFVTAGFIVLLAILVVQFIYALVTPLPVPSSSPPAVVEGRYQTDLTIFTRFDPFRGNAPQPEQIVVETASETQLNLKLFGTFLGEAPSAIVSGADGKQSVYFLGDEIASGVIIREIRPNQILLDRRGALETLTLENRDEIKQGGSLPGRSNLRGNINGILDLADIVRVQPDPDGGGVLLFAGRRPEIFEAAKLQNGDRLLAVDDIPLSTGGAELAALPAKLGRRPVPITIERNGTRLEMELELTGLTP